MNMFCYSGLDSPIRRRTHMLASIKASNLPGNRCRASMSSLHVREFLALKGSLLYLPHPFSSSYPFSVQGVITLTLNKVTIVTPRQEILPSSLSLCFEGGGAPLKALSSISKSFVRHSTMVLMINTVYSLTLWHFS